jgi:hypothetical protein
MQICLEGAELFRSARTEGRTHTNLKVAVRSSANALKSTKNLLGTKAKEVFFQQKYIFAGRNETIKLRHRLLATVCLPSICTYYK